MGLIHVNFTLLSHPLSHSSPHSVKLSFSFFTLPHPHVRTHSFTFSRLLLTLTQPHALLPSHPFTFLHQHHLSHQLCSVKLVATCPLVTILLSSLYIRFYLHLRLGLSSRGKKRGRKSKVWRSLRLACFSQDQIDGISVFVEAYQHTNGRQWNVHFGSVRFSSVRCHSVLTSESQFVILMIEVFARTIVLEFHLYYLDNDYIWDLSQNVASFMNVSQNRNFCTQTFF